MLQFLVITVLHKNVLLISSELLRDPLEKKIIFRQEVSTLDTFFRDWVPTVIDKVNLDNRTSAIEYYSEALPQLS